MQASVMDGRQLKAVVEEKKISVSLNDPFGLVPESACKLVNVQSMLCIQVAFCAYCRFGIRF